MIGAIAHRFALIVVFSLSSVGLASAQKVGSTSMQFLKVMPSARGAALGEAYSVMATGAEAVHWNPAGIVGVQGHEFSATYVDWLFDSQQGAFSYALSMGRRGSLGLQIQYVDFGTFEETTNERPYINDPNNPGFTGRTFRPFSYMVGVAYARDMTDRFALGFGAKFAHESLFDQRSVNAMVRQGVFEDVDTYASGFLFDFGIRYITGYRSIEIGAAVQNFGPDVTYAVESYPVPLMFRVGIASDIVGPDGLLMTGSAQNRLRAAVDLFHPNDYAQQIHAGLEYDFQGIFAIRGGYKFFYDSDGLTLGAGLTPTFRDLRLSVDYSYGSMGTYLGHVQRVSLGVAIR